MVEKQETYPQTYKIMALIDLLTNLSSFDYDKIGTKQGEYLGEDKATGFTPNRQQGDPTEFKTLQLPEEIFKPA